MEKSKSTALDELLKLNSPQTIEGKSGNVVELVDIYRIMTITCNACNNTMAYKQPVDAFGKDGVLVVAKQAHIEMVKQKMVLCSTPIFVIGYMPLLVDSGLVKNNDI